MFKLSNQKLRCAIDIGTNKTVCVIFSENTENGFQIKSWGHKKSFGIKKSRIDNLKITSETISKVLYEALQKNKLKNRNIISNISDLNIFCEQNYTHINLDGFKVGEKELKKILKKNIQGVSSEKKRLIYSVPINFDVDKRKKLASPIGLNCQKLGLTSFNVFVNLDIFNNLENCLKNSDLILANSVDTAFASAVACLDENEKKRGVICIDIGAGSSKIATYFNNKLEYLSYIPLGGNDVTNDISNGLEISNELAEYIKIVYGSVEFSSNEKLKINLLDGTEKIITKNLLNGIIKPRYEEIFEIIRENLNQKILNRLAIKRIVFTGGASQIKGINNLSEKIFNRKSRVSGPKSRFDYFNNKPEFSTIIGLMKTQGISGITKCKSVNSLNYAYNLVEKIDDWITDSFT